MSGLNNISLAGIGAAMRGAVQELVARRLWPLAVALVLAIVAVPVALTQHPAPAPAASFPSPASLAPTTVTPTQGGREVEVTLAQGKAPLALTGSFHDPFEPQPLSVVPAASATASGSSIIPGTSGTSGAGGASSGTSGGGSSSHTGGSGSTSSGSTPPPAAPPQSRGPATVDVLFGLSGQLKLIKAVAPGSALPSASNPVVVFLGVKNGVAQFLLSADATASGPGTCKPSASVCEEVDLSPRQTENLQLVNGSTPPPVYQLELVRIRS